MTRIRIERERFPCRGTYAERAEGLYCALKRTMI